LSIAMLIHPRLPCIAAAVAGSQFLNFVAPAFPDFVASIFNLRCWR